MIKNNKLKFIISCVLILLPILVGLVLWNELPARMTTHWGGDGVPDGTMGKAAAIFILPCVLLVLHIVCLFISSCDKRYKDQSKKIVGLTFWIMPALSVVVNGMMYAISLDAQFDVGIVVYSLLGVMFIVIGNYLPKSRRNSVYGIKIAWSMGNDENWTKTHRLGGILWVACGFVVMLAALLPVEIGMITILFAVLLAVVVPTVYSYIIYIRHKADGIEYDFTEFVPHTKAGKWIVAIGVPILLILFVVLMFFGSVDVTFGEESFVINATFSESLEVSYDEIDSIEIRDDLDTGARVMGFGSPRLSTGTFENDEFGRYTLYAHTNAEFYLVLKSGDDVLVIGGAASNMHSIFAVIYEKIGE